MDHVAHFDIPVSDPGLAKKFYTDIFGWKIEEIPGANYWMIYTTPSDPKKGPKKPGAINGGMAKVTDAGDLTQPYFTVEVKDVQATLAKVEAAGGKVIQPFKNMGDWGSMAVFADPEGKIIGLHSK